MPDLDEAFKQAGEFEAKSDVKEEKVEAETKVEETVVEKEAEAKEEVKEVKEEKLVTSEAPKEETKEEVVDKKEEEVKSFREKYDVDFESEEDLVAAYNELKNKEADSEPKYASDYIKQLNELEASGVKVTPELLAEMGNDWSKLEASNPDDALKIVAKNMKLNNPQLDQSDIDFKLKKMYGYNEDKRRSELEDRYDEDKVNEIIEAERAEINKELEIEAKLAKPALQEYQSKLTRAERQESKPIDNSGFLKSASESVKNLESLSIQSGDTNIDVPVSKEVRTGIEDTIKSMVSSDPNKFWESVGGMEGLAKSLAIAKSVDAIGEEFTKRATSAATEEVVNDLTNQKSNQIKSAEGVESEKVAQARTFVEQLQGQM